MRTREELEARRAESVQILEDLKAFCDLRNIDLVSCDCNAGIHIVRRSPEEASEYERTLLAHVLVTSDDVRGALSEWGEDEDDVVVR